MSKITTYKKHLALVDFDKLPKSIKRSMSNIFADRDNWYIECSNLATKKYYEFRYGVK